MATEMNKRVAGNETEGDENTGPAMAEKPKAYLDLYRPDETEVDLEKLKNGEVTRLLGQRMMRMMEVSEYASYNAIHAPQTEATFRMLTKRANEADKLFLEYVKVLQAMKYRPGSDEIVQTRIYADKGLDSSGIRRGNDGMPIFGDPDEADPGLDEQSAPSHDAWRYGVTDDDDA